MILSERLATHPFQRHDRDRDLPEDGMQNIEMVVASEGVKLG